jgi:hypothetical protein
MDEDTTNCGPSAPLRFSASSWILRASSKASNASYAHPRWSRLSHSKNAFGSLRASSVPRRQNSSASSYSPISDSPRPSTNDTSASARSCNSRDMPSTSRATCIPSLRRPCKILSYARSRRHCISMALVPALHEARNPVAAGPIEGRSLRGGRRLTSSRLSAAPSSA